MNFNIVIWLCDTVTEKSFECKFYCHCTNENLPFRPAGYEQQATHNVIGEMIKSRFVGNGNGPRPNEIVQVMRGDYNVSISYWKAWRSREVAQEYAKGSAGASYKMLPDYLNKLVLANPGTVTELHTVYDGGVGHRFKYMFLAMGASISGYQHMRPVIIIDGAHLSGKYAGCLLTASAEDGSGF